MQEPRDDLEQVSTVKPAPPVELVAEKNEEIARVNEAVSAAVEKYLADSLKGAARVRRLRPGNTIFPRTTGLVVGRDGVARHAKFERELPLAVLDGKSYYSAPARRIRLTRRIPAGELWIWPEDFPLPYDGRPPHMEGFNTSRDLWMVTGAPQSEAVWRGRKPPAGLLGAIPKWVLIVGGLALAALAYYGLGMNQ